MLKRVLLVVISEYPARFRFKNKVTLTVATFIFLEA